jgi:hypothetical protein
MHREAKEAIRRLHATATEVEKIRLELSEADASLRDAGVRATSPLSLGVAELVEARDDLRQKLTDAETAIVQAFEIVDLAKGALVATTSPDHPWYRPGEPDGAVGYHCPRCKALNEIEMWRRVHAG